LHEVDQLQIAFDANGLFALQIALGFVMFGVALDLKVDDFRSLARDPRGPVVGLICQFLILPALACPLALAVAASPSMALGLMLVAACPGGNVSNFLTQLSGGKLSVSVGMTAVSTLAAVVVTPLNLTFWGTRSASTAALVREVALDPVDMLGSVAVLLLVPVALGMATVRFAPEAARQLKRVMTVLSTVFFAIVVAVAFANNLDIFLQGVKLVFLPVLLLHALAFGLGYGASWGAGLDEPSRRAVAFEVGIQNSGLGLVLIFSFFDGLGGMAVVAAWWGIWHVVAGFAAVAVFRWRDRQAMAISSASDSA
jgi:BASS family bile acid:Na+ symporter